MVAVPDVGRSSPRINRIVVVLPAPLGPRNPVTTPGSTVQVRSSTARVRPNTLVNAVNSIIAAIMTPRPAGHRTPVDGSGRSIRGAGWTPAPRVVSGSGRPAGPAVRR